MISKSNDFIVASAKFLHDLLQIKDNSTGTKKYFNHTNKSIMILTAMLMKVLFANNIGKSEMQLQNLCRLLPNINKTDFSGEC